MAGLGTIINVVAILFGGFIGKVFGKYLNERYQITLNQACGLCVLFIGISGAVSGMIVIDQGTLVSGKSMLVIACLALGAVFGELFNLEDKFERFGEWLKLKSGNAKDKSFVEGFVTASLTVSIGAMAIVGSINDGILNDPSILITKAVLDFIIVLVMTTSMGIGCLFSAIPVGLFQGAITFLARLIKPLMTTQALANLSLIGSLLIFCVGVNLIWDKKIRVANLLPSLVFAIIFAFLPLNF